MREIKFRIWDTKEKKMLHKGICDEWNDGYESGCTYISLDLDGKLIGRTNDDGGKNGLWEHDVKIDKDCFVLMQFTGLKDKNGKEEKLYHKDVVLITAHFDGDCWQKTTCVIIEWADGGWVIVNKQGYYICSLWDYVHNHCGGKQGNIYENPELLEAKSG